MTVIGIELVDHYSPVNGDACPRCMVLIEMTWLGYDLDESGLVLDETYQGRSVMTLRSSTPSTR